MSRGLSAGATAALPTALAGAGDTGRSHPSTDDSSARDWDVMLG